MLIDSFSNAMKIHLAIIKKRIQNFDLFAFSIGPTGGVGVGVMKSLRQHVHGVNIIFFFF